MNIRKLPQDLARKIAAGEVIERPVSVVKELVENAVDASPSRITVQVFQGGKSRITVQDDGEGIFPEDLPLAIERHATSKIHNENDLEDIHTMGYRGEALSSISAVSRVEIRSRRKDHQEGNCLVSAPGNRASISIVHCPSGTRVQVDDLFFNMPARRKFLSSALGEFRRISQLIRHFALAQPEIVFDLSHDGKKIFQSVSGPDRGKLIHQAWGSGYGILSKSLSMNDMNIEVWFQNIPGRRLNFQAFVNRRIIDDKLLRSAVHSVKDKLSGNLFIFLQVPPKDVDVNIHPTKTEIRYRKSREVFELARNSVMELLGHIPSINIPGQDRFLEEKPGVKVNNDSPLLISHGTTDKRGTTNISYSCDPFPDMFSRVAAPSSILSENRKKDTSSDMIKEDPLKDLARWRFIEQSSTGYLLFDFNGDLVVMDPHAAHERINFELLRENSRTLTEKQLLHPPGVLAPEQEELVAQYLPQLEKYGFLFTNDGSGKIRMSAFPLLLSRFSLDPIMFLDSLLYEWEEGTSTTIDNGILAKWANLACKDSVKLTSRISEEEVAVLLRDLSKCNNPHFCPHGRPTMLCITSMQIEKYFRRTE